MVVVRPAAAKGKERTNVRRRFCRKRDIQMIICAPAYPPLPPIPAFANLWSSFSN